MVAEETLLTVDDVNQRLPLVKSIVKDIVVLHADISLRKQRLQSLRERHPAPQSAESVYEQEVQQMETELFGDEEKLATFTDELQQIGGVLTNPEVGRVDFPGELSGERVQFCWQAGQSEIMFWHTGECGMSDRVSLFHEMGSGGFSSDDGMHRDSK